MDFQNFFKKNFGNKFFVSACFILNVKISREQLEQVSLVRSIFCYASLKVQGLLVLSVKVSYCERKSMLFSSQQTRNRWFSTEMSIRLQ